MSLIYKAQSRILVGGEEDSATMCVSGLRSLYFIELLDFILGCPCSVAKLPVSSTDLWSAHKVDNVVFRADQLAEGCFIASGNASSGRIGLLLFFVKQWWCGSIAQVTHATEDLGRIVSSVQCATESHYAR
jgi:hypothetical protein